MRASTYLFLRLELRRGSIASKNCCRAEKLDDNCFFFSTWIVTVEQNKLLFHLPCGKVVEEYLNRIFLFNHKQYCFTYTIPKYARCTTKEEDFASEESLAILPWKMVRCLSPNWIVAKISAVTSVRGIHSHLRHMFFLYSFPPFFFFPNAIRR